MPLCFSFQVNGKRYRLQFPAPFLAGVLEFLVDRFSQQTLTALQQFYERRNVKQVDDSILVHVGFIRKITV